MKTECVWIYWNDGTPFGSFIKPSKAVVAKAVTVVMIDREKGETKVLKDRSGAFDRPRNRKLFA